MSEKALEAALARMVELHGAPPRRELDSVRIVHEGELSEEEAARQIALALYDLPGE